MDRVSRRDVLGLACGAVVLGAVDVLLLTNGPPTTGWAGPHAGLALQLAVDASLVALVRFPRAVAALAVVVTALMAWSDALAPGLFTAVPALSPITVPRAAPIVVVWLVVHGDRRAALVTTVALAALGARFWAPSWTVTPLALLSTVVPALGALYVVARRDLLRSLRDRADRAEREQHLLAERARADERRRLAGDMHDVVTHRVSLIVLQAGALGVASAEPGVRAAAEDIRAAGAQALAELRDLVGVLRTDPDGPVPATARGGAPAPPDPATLAEESAAVGVPVVELDVRGEPADVSPTVARTAHRVVQEALTNVRKHAPGAEVRVRLHYRPDGVRVRVANSAATAPPDPALAGSGTGSGLRGLRERVGLVGGSLHAGATDGGGFCLTATLPGYVPTSVDGGPTG